MKARDEAAQLLGGGVDEARALETVVTTPGASGLTDGLLRSAVSATILYEDSDSNLASTSAAAFVLGSNVALPP